LSQRMLKCACRARATKAMPCSGQQAGAEAVTDYRYYMCECHLRKNYFVRSLGEHLSYDGDDLAFVQAYAGSFPEEQLEEALSEVKRQRDKRLRAPNDSESRREHIAKTYSWLHPELLTLDSKRFLQPGLLELATICKQVVAAGGRSLSFDALEKLEDDGLLTQLRDGLWTFPVLTDSFCDLLEGELQQFLASGLPRTAPNTMNRFGVILAELGLDTGLIKPMVDSCVNPIADILLPRHTAGLDSFRAFTVLYDAAEGDGDRDLALHYDNAEVTLNVNIGGTWAGGQVAFYGLATDPNVDTGQRGLEVTLKRGWGVLHAGLDLHKALPITSGRRHNLIFWCRSSGIRNKRCPMCFEPPVVVETTRLTHEGFTVPPCRIGTLQSDTHEAVAEEKDDDLYI